MGPVDVNQAFVRGGKLVVVDARGQPWTFDGSKSKKDKAPAPSGAEHAFVLNERLIVLDGSGVWWTYNPANSVWAEGNAIDDTIAMSPTEEEAAKDDPWTRGPNVEASTLHADEERRAQAVIDARDEAKKKDKKKEAA